MALSKAQIKSFGRDVAALIIKYGGWLESEDTICFPSVWAKQQFEKESRK